MSIFDSIQKPTLLLNEPAVRANIHRMAEKARNAGVRFRPHFKTHQSAEIGEWFRPEGVRQITVSSLDMAVYFADHGWEDILVAFPVNLREIAALNALAARVHLSVLIESAESAVFLGKNLSAPVDAWIKIDSGAHRTGLAWDETTPLTALARQIQAVPGLRLRGLLTHAGHTYPAVGSKAVQAVYYESVARIAEARDVLVAAGVRDCEVSVGDTPGAVLSSDFGPVDEIRPGNFVFYDAHQLLRGVCSPQDVAVAVACPVVARHAERSEIVIYGGAIHLSKDFVQDGERRVYGLVALPDEENNGWSAPLEGAYVRSLSQEHGVLVVPTPDFEKIQVGDLVCILPAHSCLTVQVMRAYRSLSDGRVITTLN